MPEFEHRFVPGSGQTLLLLHGTGGDENDLLPIGPMLLPGAALLSPRGKVLENGMPRFFRRLREGVFDLEDLRFRTTELADFVVAAAKRYGFDPARVVAAGYSNGANIAAAMMLLRPEILSGAVLFHAMVPLVPEAAPDLTGKQVFLSAGRRDPIVPAALAEKLAEMLKSYGADVHAHWEPGGHELSRSEISAAQGWLKAGGLAHS
jgi:predicted esterase